MSIDSTTAYDVYLGAWIDWSRGRVLGATLTLTRPDGTLLIAFLAFFVALVGARFWRIACLSLHYIYSSEGHRDGVHHQRQLFLRNAPNPEGAVWTLADMAFSWRGNAKRAWARLFPIFSLAIACAVGFTLAGGFSSRVATITGSQVLLSGANCAWLRPQHDISGFSDSEGPMVTQSLMAAESYARQCYESSPVGTGSCGTYVKRNLPPGLVDTNASCPFDGKICKKPSGNLLIDTGLLDSLEDFGRNTPPDQRVQYRIQLHCAPLATEGYRYRISDKEQSYTTYYYGSSQNINGSRNNYTAQFSNDKFSHPDIEELTRYGGDTLDDFSIRQHSAIWGNGSTQGNYSSFFPIPELRPQDARLAILFLTSGRLLFGSPVYDDWYEATDNTTQIHKLTVGEGNATFFRQSEPGSPIACRTQEQFCYTGAKLERRCTPLQSPWDAGESLYGLLDDGEQAWMKWFFLTTYVSEQPIDVAIDLLGVQILMARKKHNGPLMGSLPDNQWQLEVQHWHATTMALLQSRFLESMVGYTDPKMENRLVRPNSTVERQICASQKIRSDSFISVSIIAIVCIFGGGAFIVLLSFALEPIMSWYIKRGRFHYAKLEWSTNETLQL